jgi:hypothetical protein
MNLVLARPDGKLGPKLEKSTTDCQALFALVAAAGRAAWWAGGRGAGWPARSRWPGRGGPPPFDDFSQKVPCGLRIGPATCRAARSRSRSSRSSCHRTSAHRLRQDGLEGTTTST